jgi:hypothetical protein
VTRSRPLSHPAQRGRSRTLQRSRKPGCSAYERLVPQASALRNIEVRGCLIGVLRCGRKTLRTQLLENRERCPSGFTACTEWIDSARVQPDVITRRMLSPTEPSARSGIGFAIETATPTRGISIQVVCIDGVLAGVVVPVLRVRNSDPAVSTRRGVVGGQPVWLRSCCSRRSSRVVSVASHPAGSALVAGTARGWSACCCRAQIGSSW